MVNILLNLLFLIIGMVFLIKGADFFVEGASNVAKALKIPSLIIGLTLVSIGTSLPELSVSVNSALQNASDMSFGNVLGSNIFNVLVVIGASALFTPMMVSKSIKKFDIPVVIGLYLVLTLFAFVITPGAIQLFEGLILLVLFVAYLVFLVIRSKKDATIEEEVEEKPAKKWWVNALFIILGLAGIIAGGEFVVTTASALALKFGMSELLVSLTIVAVGTSLPELVTSMVAAKKGENDIAVGNAIGSCLFNISLILGTSALFNTLAIQSSSLVDVLVMIGCVVLVLLFALKSNKVNKTCGGIMVAIYVVYLVYIVLRNIYPQYFAF